MATNGSQAENQIESCSEEDDNGNGKKSLGTLDERPSAAFELERPVVDPKLRDREMEVSHNEVDDANFKKSLGPCIDWIKRSTYEFGGRGHKTRAEGEAK